MGLLPSLLLCVVLLMFHAAAAVASHTLLPLAFRRGAGPARRPEAVPGNATAGRLRAALPRHLLGLATIRLTGSVEEGSYYAGIGLGTPPQFFELIIDTGSTLMFVPCISCGDNCGTDHMVRPSRRGGGGLLGKHYIAPRVQRP